MMDNINEPIDTAIAQLKDAVKLAQRAKVQDGKDRERTLGLAINSADGATAFLRVEQNRPERERRAALRGGWQ